MADPARLAASSSQAGGHDEPAARRLRRRYLSGRTGRALALVAAIALVVVGGAALVARLTTEDEKLDTVTDLTPPDAPLPDEPLPDETEPSPALPDSSLPSDESAGDSEQEPANGRIDGWIRQPVFTAHVAVEGDEVILVDAGPINGWAADDFGSFAGSGAELAVAYGNGQVMWVLRVYLDDGQLTATVRHTQPGVTFPVEVQTAAPEVEDVADLADRWVLATYLAAHVAAGPDGRLALVDDGAAAGVEVETRFVVTYSSGGTERVLEVVDPAGPDPLITLDGSADVDSEVIDGVETVESDDGRTIFVDDEAFGARFSVRNGAVSLERPGALEGWAASSQIRLIYRPVDGREQPAGELVIVNDSGDVRALSIDPDSGRAVPIDVYDTPSG